jgi:hypothetical protein
MQGVPEGEAAFTEHVAEQLRRELKGMQVEVTGPLTLLVDGGLQANLGRIFTFCSNNPDDGSREILEYVKGFARLCDERPPPLSRDAVRIIVRNSGYVREGMQSRPLAGDLVMLPAGDAPHGIFPLTEKNNGELGLSADEVFNLGIANLRAVLKPLMEVAKIGKSGEIWPMEGDVYQSSRLALHDSWSPLAAAQGGKLIVAAPGQATVLYVADDIAAAIKALRTVVQQVMARSPRPLSSDLLRWTPQGWEVVR